MIKVNLPSLMGDKLLKPAKVARETGLSRLTVSSIYNRKAKGITFDTIDKLCRYLGCQPGDILEYVPDREVRAWHE